MFPDRLMKTGNCCTKPILSFIVTCNTGDDMQERIYGRQPVLEVLRAGRRKIYGIMLSDVRKSEGTEELIRLAEGGGIRIENVQRPELDRMTEGSNHQGVCAVCSAYQPLDEKALIALAGETGKKGAYLVLDHIQDPQNAGALIRSAECLGIDAVVIPADRAVGITPAVVRASAGATEFMRIAIVVNLVRAMKSLKEQGVWFYGADFSPDARPVWEMDFSDGVGIVVGSEGRGLSRLVREHCDFMVKIPMSGNVTSLNASVSGGMMMYEVVRQRGFAKTGV